MGRDRRKQRAKKARPKPEPKLKPALRVPGRTIGAATSAFYPMTMATYAPVVYGLASAAYFNFPPPQPSYRRG